MGRRTVALTPESVATLPGPGRTCLFWQRVVPYALGSRSHGGQAKADWVARVVSEWGPCGWILQIDDHPVGYVMYAPPAYVPRALAFPTSPPALDSVLLTTAYVEPHLRRGGLGRVLVQRMARDLVERDIRAVEAFGAASAGHAAGSSNGARSHSCVLPVGFLTGVGFKAVRGHHRYPRMRVDLRAAVSWRSDVEAALDRIRGAVHVVAPGPSPATRDAGPGQGAHVAQGLG